MARISTFDDWIDLLKEWQHDIGLDRDLIERFMPGYEFEAKYGGVADAPRSISAISKAIAAGRKFAKSPTSVCATPCSTWSSIRATRSLRPTSSSAFS